jgi:tetratricopeptide (TPR) repeat protein
VALLGDDASVQVTLRLGTQPGEGTDPDVTMDALDELLNANLLEERTAGVGVAHPLLGDASLASLGPTRRAALHCLIASALDGEAAARHLLGAFEASGLRQHARPAADAGFRAGHRARRLFSDDAALELLGGGLRAFEAMPAVEQADLVPAAVEAWLQIGEIHQERDRPADAEPALEAALALAGTDEGRARVWSAKGSLAYRNGDFATAVLAYERGIASLVEASPLVRARMQADLGWIHAREGRAEEAVSILGPATAVLADLGDAETAGHALDQMATALGTAGRAEEGLDTMQRAFALVGPTGNERQLGVLHLHRAALYGMLLRFGEALADIASSLRIARSCADLYRESVIHWMTADIHERRGDPAAALAERDAELALLAAIGNPRNAAAAHAARARLLAALGRHEEAAQAATRARDVAEGVEDEDFSASIEQLVKAQSLAF